MSNANTTLNGVVGAAALADYRIGNNAKLTIASTLGVTAGSTITFTAPNSRLVLGAGIDVSLLSGISGFGPGSSIDVSQLAASVTYADAPGANTGGVLTLRNAGGTAVGNLNLSSGDFTAGSFRLTPDGTGGTLIDFATTVTGVTASPGTADLGAGQAVVLTVTTSDAVTIAGGAPTLTLNDGGTANYNAAASSGTSLVFNYTVAPGENTPDLAVTALNLNSATAQNAVGTALNTAGASVNPAGTLQIDTLAPTVTGLTANPATAALGAGQVVTLTLATSEPVTVTGAPTLTLSDGGTATYNAAGSTGTTLAFTYTVQPGDNAADLAVTTANLNGATIRDGAGNALDLTAATGNPAGILQIDTTAPTITGVVASPANASLGAGQTVTLTLTPSEAVTVTGAPTLTLNDGGIATYLPGSSTPTALVFTTTVAPGQNTADLAITATNLNGGAITDAAGNAANLLGAAVNPAGTLVIDTTAPTITAVTTNPGSGSVGIGQTVAITLTPSEAVTVTGGTPTLTLNDGGTAGYNAAASTPTALVFTTTIAAGQNAADLSVTGSFLNGATIADPAGNAANLLGAIANPPGVLVIDGTAPAITTVTTNPGSGLLGIGATATITLATTEAVTVTGGTPTLTLNDGGTAAYNAAASTPTSLVFTTTVAAGQNAADLAITATNPNGATIADAAGNALSLAPAVTNPAGILQIDGTRPTVTSIFSNPASGSFTTGQPISIALGLSEPVVVGGAGTPTLTLNDGGVATYSPGASTPTRLVFTTTVTAGQNAAGLAVTAANLNGATINDPAGNAADLSAAQTSLPGGLVVDTTPPGVASVTTAPGSGLLGIGQTAVFTVTLTEPATLAGGSPTLTLNDGGTATFLPGSSTPTALVFTTTVAAGQNAADLTVTAVNPNGATLTDTAGNTGSLAGAVTNPAGILQVDGTPPTVTGVVTSPSSGTITPANTVAIIVSTSEPVTVTGGPPTLQLGNGGTATYAPGSSTPTGLVFTYTPVAGQDTPDLTVAGLSLNGGAIRDAAGNPLDPSGVAVNPAGVLVVDTAYHPFLPLVVTNADPNAIVTVSASLRPAVTGTYSNLGTGSIGPDGSTYTVTGTATQASAALAAVVLTPATPGARGTGYTASLSDSSPSVSTLINTSSMAASLTVTTAGDALQAGSGNDTLVGGAAGTTLIGGPGNDTLVGNVGGSVVQGGSGSSTLFSLGGNTSLRGNGPRDVFSAAAGNVTVVSAVGGSAVIGLGTGTALVNSQGADTLIGGSGSLVAGIATGAVAILGSGTAIISAAQGSTVVGGAGADTVGVRGSDILYFAGSGPTYFIGGTGSSTVQGGSGGSSTIFAGAGGGLLNGGTAGNNLIIGGAKATTIFGGGSGDTLFATGGAGTVLRAGVGNETLQGIGSSGNDTYFVGSGNNLVGIGSGQTAVFAGTGNATVVAGTGRDVFAVTNGSAGGTETIIGFKLGTDVVSLQGFAPGEVSRAAASATSSPGSATAAPATTITLSDNTRITFAGMASLDTRVFG